MATLFAIAPLPAADLRDLDNPDAAARAKLLNSLSAPNKPLQAAEVGLVVDRLREDQSAEVRLAATYPLGSSKTKAQLGSTRSIN